ncbi:hypothetical protein BJY52DRAFT_1158905, partial [Lactarius psammicola]
QPRSGFCASAPRNLVTPDKIAYLASSWTLLFGEKISGGHIIDLNTRLSRLPCSIPFLKVVEGFDAEQRRA